MEAKKTNNRTLFPVDPWKREQHQREFMAKWVGLRYYFISFWSIQEHYLVPYEMFRKHSKQVPLSWFRENFPPVTSRQGIILDFLYNAQKSIKELNFDGNHYNQPCYRSIPP